MGSTGADNPREHNTMWEKARVPVIVGGVLAGMKCESLACGTSHVAVVGSRRTGQGSSRVVTWGKGAQGQLGVGRPGQDHNMPQVRVRV